MPDADFVRQSELGDTPVLRPSSAAVSARMSRHPRRDTLPEMRLRRGLHANGLRYRVQYRVPGLARRTIDIAFPRRKIAVFLDGCFWHGCAEHGGIPASNRLWWEAKIGRNRARDVETTEWLTASGWLVVRIWEHEPTRDAVTLVSQAVASRT